MGLQWREGLSVGNDLIDSDHKHLIGIINLADQSLQTKDQPGLAAALDQLVRYSKTHFSEKKRLPLLSISRRPASYTSRTSYCLRGLISRGRKLAQIGLMRQGSVLVYSCAAG